MLSFYRMAASPDLCNKAALRVKEVGMARALKMVGLPLDGTRNIAQLLPGTLSCDCL